MIFIGDANTALATMLSGDAQYLSESILYADEGAVLEQEWGARGGGSVHYSPVVFRITEVQFRPAAVDPPELLDVRVRRALAHGMDVEAAFASSTGGKGLRMTSLTPPTKDYYADIQGSIRTYPYDPRRTQQLLEEVGLIRGSDGLFTKRSGEPFRVQVATDGGTTNERENAIFVDSLRRSGVDATGHVVPVAQLRDAQARALLPGLSTGGLPQNRYDQFTSSSVPRPENRWQGNNRGGWENAEYDQVWTAFSSTLDRAQRVQQIARLEQIFTEEVAAIPHFYSTTVTAFASDLVGPVATTTPDGGRGILKSWEWDWRR